MLPNLLLTLASGLQAPAPIEIPTDLTGHDVVAVVQTSATHFCAENPSTESIVIRIGLLDVGPVGGLTLAPGARVVYPFPRGGADHMWFEAFTRNAEGVTRSRKLHLTGAEQASENTLFIERTNSCLVAWRNDQPLELVDPFASLPPHIPGHPPVDAPADLPPVISDKTLPPA